MSDANQTPPNPPLPRGGSGEQRSPRGAAERPDPRRYIPPTRTVIDHAASNEQFLRKILAIVTVNADVRLDGQRFGEVVVRLKYVDGHITEARMVEETILKNESHNKA